MAYTPCFIDPQSARLHLARDHAALTYVGITVTGATMAPVAFLSLRQSPCSTPVTTSGIPARAYCAAFCFAFSKAAARALSSAATRTHVDTDMDAWRRLVNSACSSAVVSTLTSVSRRSASATGGRPIRGFVLPFFPWKPRTNYSDRNTCVNDVRCLYDHVRSWERTQQPRLEPRRRAAHRRASSAVAIAKRGGIAARRLLHGAVAVHRPERADLRGRHRRADLHVPRFETRRAACKHQRGGHVLDRVGGRRERTVRSDRASREAEAVPAELARVQRGADLGEGACRVASSRCARASSNPPASPALVATRSRCAMPCSAR